MTQDQYQEADDARLGLLTSLLSMAKLLTVLMLESFSWAREVEAARASWSSLLITFTFLPIRIPQADTGGTMASPTHASWGKAVSFVLFTV